MPSSPARDARPRVIDVHAHVIVPEVYAMAAEHNIFFELPTEPGVTDAMRDRIKERAASVLARMSDIDGRIAHMDAMGVDVQVLSASLVHQGLEWADAQTGLALARTTNDWIAEAVATHPARSHRGSAPCRCTCPRSRSGSSSAACASSPSRGSRSRPRPPEWSSVILRCGRSGPRPRSSGRPSTSIPAAIATVASSAIPSGTASARPSRRPWRSRR